MPLKHDHKNSKNLTNKFGKITCLGKKFSNDDERRKYFTDLLAKKLKDPEFKKIEGFPIGCDENILDLSDPPYYTACPNPWLNDFIEQWENEKIINPDTLNKPYYREPFAANVGEKRSGIFYDAHSYHTKVPHKAIMRYILHYTQPGDIVFDGFCGTGMTGVAAQLCGDQSTVESLGYKVDKNGIIFKLDENQKSKQWIPFSKLGPRKALLNDLSPSAAFIAYNFNSPVNTKIFEDESKTLIYELEKEIGWIYETLHSDKKSKGKINYTIWSDVFICSNCGSEIVFWDQALDHENNKLKKEIECQNCGAKHLKKQLNRAWVSQYSQTSQKPVKKAKQIPVLINYSLKGKRYEKCPDKEDFKIIEKISKLQFDLDFINNPIPDGYNTRQPKSSHGVYFVEDFYTKRNLYAISMLRKNLPKGRIGKALNFLINSYDLTHSTLMTRIIFKGGSKKPVLTGYQSGTLYIPSLPVEKNIFQGILKQKLPIILKSLNSVEFQQLIFTGSASQTNIKSETIDYLFIDPPFGSNIMYSELNYLSESWSKVFTNDKPEAIENKVKNKTLSDYRKLMLECFKEAYRVMKKGRWITVEFSNTKASVWNSIQTALAEAGFIIANVSALDKKQGSFKAVTTPTAVKQDLVISAYKPSSRFEKKFESVAHTQEGVWDFVSSHLQYLPIIKKQGINLISIPERDPRILYDQVITYYVRKGYNVPIDSQEFQLGLSKKFHKRDGMYFLLEQAAEYDRKKTTATCKPCEQSLFVFDEASAIEWLRSLINTKPQSFQDINPLFMKEISAWSKNEVSLELSTLLEQNFLIYDGKGPVPQQIHSYLSANWKEMRNLEKNDPLLISKAKGRWYVPDPNKAADLEKLREKSLIKEFEEYAKAKKQLKVFRIEAVRAGFKKAWQEKNYNLIISVAKKIPDDLLEKDPKLLMWYDQAITRTNPG
ncbi:MAG: DNA methyltransferase [Desulforegulaceae bacterium]|nr:DNA methyltransferase [Desulforegulaceae bacterium]